MSEMNQKGGVNMPGFGLVLIYVPGLT